jgi:hypothetical protein
LTASTPRNPWRRPKRAAETVYEPLLVNPHQAAALLGCDEITLRKARSRGCSTMYAALPWVKTSTAKNGPVRYELAEIRRFIAKHRRAHPDPEDSAPPVAAE